LKLIPFVISPHTDETNIDAIKEYADKVNYPVVALTDKQAILVENGVQKIVGAGEKYVFNTNIRL